MLTAPTLAEVAQRPELIDGLPPAVCGALVIQVAGLQERLGVRMRTVLAHVPVPAAEDPTVVGRLPRRVAIEYRRAIKHLDADLEAHIAASTDLAGAADVQDPDRAV